MHTIYSYRLTGWSGAAPCMDDSLLTLALCKRDMRRVIGREYNRRKHAGSDDAVWFIGIVGKALHDRKAFRDAFPDLETGDILYIAKLTDVLQFEDYFSNVSDNRRDKIYFPDPGGEYGNEKKFSPKEDNGIHETKELWDRDWDVQHGSREAFLLLSDRFAVLTHAQSETLKACIPSAACFPGRQGHKHFDASDGSTFVRYLYKLTDPADNPDKGKNVWALCAQSCCGKVNAV